VSQAFAKEGDAADDFPERPISGEPNYVTPRGLRLLREEVERLLARRAGAHGEDRKLLERDLRYYQARVDSAVLVERPGPPPADARFGARVTLDDGTVYEIVGEDEADPAAGRLAWSAPLARALIGLKPGDSFEFGGATRRVVALAY
jgi:transcription elongation GreA/GreB family factor